MEQFLIRFAAEEAAEHASGIAVLGVNPEALFLQLVTFIILFLILKRFAFGSIAKMLDERRHTIDQGVDLGREMEAEKAKLDEQVDQVLHKARQEADKILAAGHVEASEIIKQAETAATRKAEALLADARAKMDKDIESARKGLEKETLALVAEATEAIIHEKLDANKDAELMKRALRSVK